MNASVNSTVTTVKEVQQEVQTVSNNVTILSEKVDSGYITNKVFEDYKTEVEATYAKTTDVSELEEAIDENFTKKTDFEDLVQRVETLENNGENSGGDDTENTENGGNT